MRRSHNVMNRAQRPINRILGRIGNGQLRIASGLKITAERAMPEKNSADRIQSNNKLFQRMVWRMEQAAQSILGRTPVSPGHLVIKPRVQQVVNESG